MNFEVTRLYRELTPETINEINAAIKDVGQTQQSFIPILLPANGRKLTMVTTDTNRALVEYYNEEILKDIEEMPSNEAIDTSITNLDLYKIRNNNGPDRVFQYLAKENEVPLNCVQKVSVVLKNNEFIPSGIRQLYEKVDITIKPKNPNMFFVGAQISASEFYHSNEILDALWEKVRNINIGLTALTLDNTPYLSPESYRHTTANSRR